MKDLDGIEFWAQIMVEPAAIGSTYNDQNKINRAIVPGDKQWDALKAGQDVPPEPVGKKAAGAPAGAAGAVAEKPKWATNPTTAAKTESAPATVVAAAAAKAGGAGPAWLNGK